MKNIGSITGYHAHIYFKTPTEQHYVLALLAAIAERFPGVRIGRVHEKPVGPHPVGMCQVAFTTDVFTYLVPFLMLNQAGLSVLVHPETGDDLSDHTIHALWLGERLPLNTSIFE
jgi:DOPA 4,5-dioxygenase